MGGSPVTIFTTTTLDCTFSLSLKENIYWTENCFGTDVSSVRFLNLTTHAESIIVESDTIHPYFGVTAFNGSVFWTGIAAVHTATIESGTYNQIYHNPNYGGSLFRGIVVIDPSLQPDNRTVLQNSSIAGVTTTHLQPSPTTAGFMTTAGTNHTSTSIKTQIDQNTLSSTSNEQIYLTTTIDSSVVTERESVDTLKTLEGEEAHVRCNHICFSNIAFLYFSYRHSHILTSC